MANCPPGILIDGVLRCPVCNRRLPPGNAAVNCGKGRTAETPKAPGRVRRAVKYVTSLARHKLRGEPKCTPAEITDRLAVCVACPIFRPSKQHTAENVDGACGGCGCRIARSPTLELKVEWADQSCPLELWPLTAWQQARA